MTDTIPPPVPSILTWEAWRNTMWVGVLGGHTLGTAEFDNRQHLGKPAAVRVRFHRYAQARYERRDAHLQLAAPITLGVAGLILATLAVCVLSWGRS